MSELVRLARQALADKVRQQPAKPDWLAAWRELATLTAGITKEDSRQKPVLGALEACDTAYLANDWPGFQRAVQQVKAALNKPTIGLDGRRIA